MLNFAFGLLQSINKSARRVFGESYEIFSTKNSINQFLIAKRTIPFLLHFSPQAKQQIARLIILINFN